MPAHDLLRAWFVRTRTKATAFAQTVGVSRQTVHSWLNGAVPKVNYLTAIDVATGGAVPIRSWFDKSEAS